MSTRVEYKSMPQYDAEAARKMGAAVGGLAAFIVEINNLKARVEALERAAGVAPTPERVPCARCTSDIYCEMNGCQKPAAPASDEQKE